jgi:hypothetical protein
MGNGLEIQPNEQKELLHNARAVTHRLPDELNPLAMQTSDEISIWLPDESANSQIENSFPLRSRNVRSIVIGDEKSLGAIPAHDDGCTLNPTCYQQWQPQTVEDEPVCASAFKERLAAFYQQRSLCSHRLRSFGKDRANELDELNAWLADPILKHEAMARVMRSDDYTIKFDDKDEPKRVVMVKS